MAFRRSSLTAALVLLSSSAAAQVAVERSVTRLPSSNGFTAILADLPAAKLTHFREHLFATEEPLLDAAGNEVWVGNQPQVVHTRDLLYDAYFGLRSDGTQRWLTTVPVDLDQSGYETGTGIIRWVQQVGELELTTFAFAPRSLPRAGFVMALRVRNTGAAPHSGISVFSLHNFHLGFGRPGVMADLGENGETVQVHAGTGGAVDLEERAFAGVVVTRALGGATHRAAWHDQSPAAQNGFLIVDGGGAQDLPDPSGTLPVGNGYAHALQFDIGTLAPGAEAWRGVAVAHHADPFAGAAVRQALDSLIGSVALDALIDAERSAWAGLQAQVQVPPGATADEEALARHSAAVLAMAQVRSGAAFLREWLSEDGQQRHTRFPGPGGQPAQLPAEVSHRGAGAILASLPPGEWTYAWIRDGAYAIAALSELGLGAEAAAGLAYYLNAESGRFQNWNELAPYEMPPYQITLTRYHGFGVEETDFNDFGPNLEFDGFGLFLWALRHHERSRGGAADGLADQHWSVISTRIADPLVKLVDPATGLIRADSSIWETHWNGRQRHWAYTSITAARGLCDAAEIADRQGDAQRATQYRATADALRHAIATRLTDAQGAIASNLEELQSGSGYFDAAVLDAIAMGLFDPEGRIAKATLDALDAQLRTEAGAGWARNDDRADHAGKSDLSPWGSEYDSAEWVITNLRGAVALRMAGRTARADEILDWVRRQSVANYLTVAETYDEQTGRYKFNAPMAGFGAGAWVLALAHRGGSAVSPACGAYYDESASPPDAGTPKPDGGGPVADGGTQQADGGTDPGGTRSCRCASVPGMSLILLLAASLLLGRRRRRDAGAV